jgi:poly(A) polymerase
MLYGSRQELDRAIERVMAPVGAAFGVARRDRELARQILMAHRRMTDVRRKRRRTSLAQRQYFHDALIFLGISVRALGDDRSELSRWKALAAAPEEPAPAKAGDRATRKRTRRRRSGRRPKKADGDGREAAPSHDG